MRVVDLFHVEEIGGAEGVLLNLVRHARRARYGAVVLSATGNAGAVGRALTRANVDAVVVRRGRMLNPFDVLRCAAAIRRAVRRFDADVVLTNAPQGYAYARAALSGVPVALYYMAVPGERLVSNHPLEVLLRLLPPFHTFTASGRIASVLRGWGLPRVSAVHHGTALDEPDAENRRAVGEMLAQWGWEPGDPLVLVPGRLQRWKGQHVAVEAMAEIRRTLPRVKAVLLGATMFGADAGYSGALQRVIGDRGLERCVFLAGHQPVREWLDAASVVVHASIEADPFPNVCLEAMAASRPLVTNTISGVTEVLTAGVDAAIVPPGDPRALAEAVRAILRDPQAAALMAARAQETYRRCCTPDRMVAAIEDALPAGRAV